MSRDEHRQRHVELHRALDELAADYMQHNKFQLLSETSVMDLIVWSHKQTIEPEDKHAPVAAVSSN